MKKIAFLSAFIAFLMSSSVFATEGKYRLLEDGSEQYEKYYDTNFNVIAPVVHSGSASFEQPSQVGVIYYDAAGSGGFKGVNKDGEIDTLTVSNAQAVTSGANERIERATLNCDSSATVISQSGSWISIGNIASGSCALSIATGVFSAAPACVVTTKTAGTSGYSYSTNFTTATAGAVVGYNPSIPGPATSYDVDMICMGPTN